MNRPNFLLVAAPWTEAFRSRWVWCVLGLVVVGSPLRAQSAPDSFMGLGLDGVNYWSSAPFGNAAFNGSNWIEFEGSQWGTTVFTWDNPQFDPTTGLPRYLNPGRALRMLIYPMNANYSNRPTSWPVRSGAGAGRVLVTWQGEADIRLNSGSLVAGASNGPATGLIVNGRRTYQVPGPSASLWVEVHAVNPANPPTSLRVWLPDPANPTGATLEGRMWHPWFLDRLRDMPLRFLRFMDWGQTNGSPQVSWADRRLPSHVTQTGTLNRRAPATGFSGNRPTGVAWEYMVMLANEIGTDLWICVPHLADDAYIRKLARLIRFGSDGVEPYSQAVANPVFPPLRSDLKVWVEFSNEIWSSGSSFPQGNWAQEQANAQGISRARFNARQFCRTWRIFQEEFGGTSRLVRVAALFTAHATYNQEFLTEIASYGAGLTPAVTADVVSPTTYFGNGIQDWAHERAQQAAGGVDPWFYTGETFTSGGSTRPVTIPMSSPYWTSAALNRHLGETFVEWKRRIFSGASVQGGGPDATGVGGGFDAGLVALVQASLGRAVPLVSYEGGPSIYTDYLDGGDLRDDGITAFMEALNRSPGMREMYRIQLNMAFSKGLRQHGIFVGPAGSWGKFGQWGQMEFSGQEPTSSPRWQELLFLQQDLATLRPVDAPTGLVPVFDTPPRLVSGRAGQALSRTIVTSSGNGTRTLAVIGANLLPGLSATVTGDSVTVSGTAEDGGANFLYLRVRDADGDAAWRIFSLYVGGGPGVVLESNFEGINPALNLPWTSAYQVAPGWTTTGWSRGAGISPMAGDDALVWSQVMPADETASTLEAALAAQSWWEVGLAPGQGAEPLDLRGARVRFAVNRTGFHAPRRFALFASPAGFGSAQQLFVTPRLGATGTSFEFEAVLPSTPAFGGISGPVSFRLVGFGGQFSGHQVRLTDFRVRALTVGNTPPQFTENPALLSAAYVGEAYTGSLAPLVLGSGDDVTWTKASGPVWLSVAANGAVSGTPNAGDLGENTFTATATDSRGLSATLTFRLPVTSQVVSPVFLPPGGSYDEGVAVTMSTATAGASIRFTLDGSTPSPTFGTLYSGPVTLPAGTVTVRAIAFRTGLSPSSVSAASYTVRPLAVPQILSQPRDRTVAVGGEVTFQVVAEGSEPLVYQWRRNGVALAGRTQPVLNLTGVTAAQAGAYDCVVSNPFGTATSQAAVLQVLTSDSPNRPILSLPRPRIELTIPTFTRVFFLLPIENQGGLPLTWSTAAAANGGTANYYHFTVHEPTAAGELDFNWRDIIGPSQGGTELTNALSSQATAQITLPWAFRFYGANQSQMRVSRFGTLQFSEETIDGNNRTLTSTNAPGNLVAVLWDDWRLDGQSSVWWRGTAQEVVVTWQNVHHVNSTATRATFQAILFRDGRLRFQYAHTPLSGFSATVALQNGAKNTGLTVSHVNAANTRSGTAITLGQRMNELHNNTTWTTNATLNPQASAEQILSIFPGSLPSGSTWTTYVRVTSNDPDRPVEIVPITFTLGQTPWLYVYGRENGSGSFQVISNGSRQPHSSQGTLFTTAGQTLEFEGRNAGQLTLNLQGNPRVLISGEHPGDFSLVQDLPGSISPGLGSVFRIRFQPQGPGVRRAIITILSNASEPVYTFAVEGPGMSRLEYWRTQFNLPPDGPGSLSADPDGDGLTNLLEYALGGHPLVPDQAVVRPRVHFEDDLLSITFRQQSDPALAYTVQYSENLTQWVDIWTSTGTDNQDGVMTVTEPTPPSSAPHKFLRLRIAR